MTGKSPHPSLSGPPCGLHKAGLQAHCSYQADKGWWKCTGRKPSTQVIPRRRILCQRGAEVMLGLIEGRGDKLKRMQQCRIRPDRRGQPGPGCVTITSPCKLQTSMLACGRQSVSHTLLPGRTSSRVSEGCLQSSELLHFC